MSTVRKCDGKVMDDLFIEIGQGPICPLCRWWGFDDWWHSNSCRGGSPPVRLHANLRCDDCDITFEVTQYTDGETHSSYRRAPAPIPHSRDVSGTEEVSKKGQVLSESGTESRPTVNMLCTCQDQHRRGYCQEPNCPNNMFATLSAIPHDGESP